MKKKILVLGIIAIMIAMLIILTGCGNTGEENGKYFMKMIVLVEYI